MKLLLLIILFLFQAGNAVFAQVQLTNLNSYSLKENIFLLKEQDSALSIEEALKCFDEHKFSHLTLPGNYLNLGFVEDVYWLAIPLRNVSGKSVNLEAGLTNQGIYY